MARDEYDTQTGVLPLPQIKVARVYMRVSTKEQDLSRQKTVIDDAKAAGFYIAGVYAESASGASSNRPELLRMINDLQPGETVIAERMDRISRLPLDEAKQLIDVIRDRGARFAVPGVVDLSDLVHESSGVSRVVLESVQDMLLKLALQMARDDYEDRRVRQAAGIKKARQEGRYKGKQANKKLHQRIIALRDSGIGPGETADLAGCSLSTVKRVWRQEQERRQQ